MKTKPKRATSPHCVRTVSTFPFWTTWSLTQSLFQLWAPSLLPLKPLRTSLALSPRLHPLQVQLPWMFLQHIQLTRPRTSAPPLSHQTPTHGHLCILFKPLFASLPPPQRGPLLLLHTYLKCSCLFRVYLLAVCLSLRPRANLSWSRPCPQHPAQAHRSVQELGAD